MDTKSSGGKCSNNTQQQQQQQQEAAMQARVGVVTRPQAGGSRLADRPAGKRRRAARWSPAASTGTAACARERRERGGGVAHGGRRWPSARWQREAATAELGADEDDDAPVTGGAREEADEQQLHPRMGGEVLGRTGRRHGLPERKGREEGLTGTRENGRPVSFRRWEEVAEVLLVLVEQREVTAWVGMDRSGVATRLEVAMATERGGARGGGVPEVEWENGVGVRVEIDTAMPMVVSTRLGGG
uniref:DUF834 domain-containing protein n=2 Tax=Oryza sativa subsp. japonica TaxID=39947 RepID=Q10HM6_ORYSJ|nr:hypothetical protein [Oryza sativa Japonica Group]ABF97317.1 hypothetical protein LOC_Os03g38620 [Oryza sativa Japonica Group]